MGALGKDPWDSDSEGFLLPGTMREDWLANGKDRQGQPLAVVSSDACVVEINGLQFRVPASVRWVRAWTSLSTCRFLARYTCPSMENSTGQPSTGISCGSTGVARPLDGERKLCLVNAITGEHMKRIAE